MTREELEKVRDWSQEKLSSGQEPPWSWYQYMKLRETLEAILSGMNATTESSLQSDQRQGTHLRLVGPNDPQDTAQHHPSENQPQLPM